jgi:hypothetical protein
MSRLAMPLVSRLATPLASPLVGMDTAPVVPTFLLTNRTVVSGGGAGNGLGFSRNGSLVERINDANGATISGQWVATNATATIGDGYEVVPTIISGTFTGGVVNGGSYPITGFVQVMLLATGSFSVIVRVAGGGATVAGPATITVT